MEEIKAPASQGNQPTPQTSSLQAPHAPRALFRSPCAPSLRTQGARQSQPYTPSPRCPALPVLTPHA
ncbi:hypothetical protein L484_026838 [Morus notabilis]|uniref:Uncharacterized protein n=1 Tax=Morus notabilis TaxID=981085 RepID=W9RE46_9ROSA|nr:hypothetical protein L484_026838 [Morus notabilis]